MEHTAFDNLKMDQPESEFLSTKKRAALFESAINEAVWIQERNESGSRISYSQSIKKICGYSADEALELPEKHLSLISADDLADVKKELDEFYRSNRLINLILVYRLTKKDNSVKWIKEEITKNAEGNVVGLLTDITSHKEMEYSVKEYRQQLKDLTAAKDSFITILSHDLRAPFTSILGFSEILLNEPNLPILEKNEYLTYIFEASQNQLQLINYLLDWSRLQTGKLVVEPQRLKAQFIIFNCVSSLTGNAIRKNVEISIKVDEDVFINADERLITQALTNLLNNAIKFSPRNSKVEIIVNNFNKSQVEFVIRDYGIGIAEEDQSKLFKVENMFSTEGTAGEKGSGLGLPLVKEIIEKHGGEIWFYSQLNGGSEFHFTVPKPINTILVVNSNREERELIKHFVLKALPDFLIYEAESGFEAMSLIIENNPSVVISDHDLPLMNGLQLIESVKKGSSALKIPFIIIINTDSPELYHHYHSYGISSIIKRPFHFEELKKILQDIVI